MSIELVERIANAVLYEGYILYPYRASSVKNRRRFNFGVLVPPAYGALQSGADSSTMRTECLVCGTPQTKQDVRLRFLQVMPASAPESWQNAVEREVNLNGSCLADLLAHGRREEFRFQAEDGAFIEGAIAVTARSLADGLVPGSGARG